MATANDIQYDTIKEF